MVSGSETQQGKDGKLHTKKFSSAKMVAAQNNNGKKKCISKGEFKKWKNGKLLKDKKMPNICGKGGKSKGKLNNSIVGFKAKKSKSAKGKKSAKKSKNLKKVK